MTKTADYVVLNDGETFTRLEGCTIVRMTSADEKRYTEDLDNGDIRQAAKDAPRLSVKTLVELYDAIQKSDDEDMILLKVSHYMRRVRV
jgi:hypothetical protein